MTGTGRPIPPLVGARFGAGWWQRGVVYQIYPRSFADMDGDDGGDLPGIVDHLDHLGPDGLGIDAIWLSPIYPSPGHDLGYNVSDHERVEVRGWLARGVDGFRLGVFNSFLKHPDLPSNPTRPGRISLI